MTPGEIVRKMGGSSGRADILRHCSRRALERAVRSGQVERLGRGRYGLPALPDPVKAAATARGKLSHESAAQFWKMDAIVKPARIHITVPANAHRDHITDVAWHYADVDGGRLVTPPLRTVLDCARALPFNEGLAIADSALRRESITPEELAAATKKLSGPGTSAIRRVARHADGRSANPFESALRAIVIEAGITGFEPQLLIRDKGAWRVDLGDPLRRMVLEADSFAFHGARSALDRDCRRYDDLVSRDWLVLRFSWEQVMFDAGWVRATIEACCQLRASRRGGSSRRNRTSKADTAA